MKSETTKVILNAGKDQSIRRFHPWVFSGAIKKIITDNADPVEGEIVEVYDSKDAYLGTGHFATGSIAVRVFSFEQKKIDSAFWKEKITNAYNYRKQLGLVDSDQTNAYRLVFAEGDGLPGLIIDYYNGTAVFQAHSAGMHAIKEDAVAALKEIYGKELHAVYDKSEETLPKQSKTEVKNGYLFGKSKTNEVIENGNKFLIDWEEGQKTGFFVDQRDSRKLLAEYSKGKKVLNTFCYTGGFSVYAALAGAELIHSVDSSKKAIELTDKNMELNGVKKGIHESFNSDTFDFLKNKKNQYDVIVLDPPAFAKRRDAKSNAIKGYTRLNTEAIKQIKSGGIIFTYSCSQAIDRFTFNSAVMAAAIIAGRKIRIMHQLSQPADHPINIFHPEGEYLKGMVIEVE